MATPLTKFARAATRFVRWTNKARMVTSQIDEATNALRQAREAIDSINILKGAPSLSNKRDLYVKQAEHAVELLRKSDEAFAGIAKTLQADIKKIGKMLDRAMKLPGISEETRQALMGQRRVLFTSLRALDTAEDARLSESAADLIISGIRDANLADEALFPLIDDTLTHIDEALVTADKAKKLMDEGLGLLEKAAQEAAAKTGVAVESFGILPALSQEGEQDGILNYVGDKALQGLEAVAWADEQATAAFDAVGYYATFGNNPNIGTLQANLENKYIFDPLLGSLSKNFVHPINNYVVKPAVEVAHVMTALARDGVDSVVSEPEQTGIDRKKEELAAKAAANKESDKTEIATKVKEQQDAEKARRQEAIWKEAEGKKMSSLERNASLIDPSNEENFDQSIDPSLSSSESISVSQSRSVSSPSL